MRKISAQSASDKIMASTLLSTTSILEREQGDIFKLKTIALLDGVELMAWYGQVNNPLTIDMVDNSNRIHFSYVLKGKAQMQLKSTSTIEYLAREGTGHVHFGANRHGRFQHQGELLSITMMVRPDVFARWQEETNPVLWNAVASGEFFTGNYQGLELLATARTLCNQLLPSAPNSNLNKVQNRLWLHSQGLAFVGLFLEGATASQASCKLSRADQTKLKQARDILLTDFSQAPTSIELAEITGLSPSKLKRGFRQMFGNSIYDLFLEKRMLEAHHRLMTDSISVSEVAFDLGYANASHFAAAFKKRFGVNPSELKRFF